MTYKEVKQKKGHKHLKAGLKRILACVLSSALLFSGMPIGIDFSQGVISAKAAVDIDDLTGTAGSEAVSGPGAAILAAPAAFGMERAAAQTTAWTPGNSELFDASDTSVTEIAPGSTGTLTNSDGYSFLINSGKFAVRTGNGDFQVNAGAVIEIPIVSGAKSCTIELTAYSSVSSDTATFEGLTDINITESGSGWKTYTVSGRPEDSVSTVTVSLTGNNYFRSIGVSSSSSSATTSALLADDHMQASWGYTDTLLDSSGAAATQLQKSTGTYTNAEGDVLYVDATAGKFAPTAEKTRIQVNNGTKIYVPVKGSKTTIEVSMNKNCVTTADALLSDVLTVNGINNNLVSAKCISLAADAADSNYRMATIECYTNGEEGEILLTSAYADSNYFRSISVSCEELNAVNISGTVTAEEAITGNLQVIILNTATNAQYAAEVTNGRYSVDVLVEAADAVYEISINSQEYQVSAGTTQVTLNNASANVISNLTLAKMSTYILSGNILGIASGYDVSNLELVFTAEANSAFIPVVSVNTEQMTYTAKLEKGVSYSVELLGVNDYEPEQKMTGINHTADSNMDISVVMKSRYPITLSLGSTPDLSSMSVVYNFTHGDGSVYKFTDKSAIVLRDGAYTVSIGGEFEQQAYKISLGTTLTVSGQAVNHAIAFSPVTSWSFAVGSGDYYNKTIQNGTGYYQGLYIDASAGKLVPNGAVETANSAQFNTGAVIHVPVTGKCSIEVKAYQAQYAYYTINGTAADTASASTTIEYDGGAGYVDIVSTGSAYLVGITVIYPAKDVQYVEQPVMPFVAGDDTDANTAYDTDQIPRASKSESIVVQPVGQKLNITQTGGEITGAYSKISNLGYYLFPMTTDNNRLEFDMVIHSSGSSNGDGAYMGLFTNNYAYTLGIRKGTNARAIYSKAAVNQGDYAGAGGINETLEIGTPLHIEISLQSGKPAASYTIIETGETASVSLSTLADEPGYYYGLVVSDASVTITNMRYTAEDGTILYDQNACYYPEGTMPAVISVTAQAADSREYIDVSWTGSVPEGDGTYVVQMKKDNGDWADLADDVTGFSYRYMLPEGEGGNYLFRVCGQLGKAALGGSRNTFVEMTEAVYVLSALAKPVVTAKADASGIALDWQDVASAEYYQIYRYSFDEGADAVKCIATVAESAYKDTAAQAEMPYYYSVKAVSDTEANFSPFSDIIWAVATAGHTGEYVYEDEATDITITKKSYDTVFTDKIVLEGIVAGAGTLTAYVNGKSAAEQDMSAGESFSFELTAEEGRNDISLIFTDTNGDKTRKTFNFVYLTNYDIVADASYAGTDGELVNGIPTYKTVQAAVDSVPAGNSDTKVILVMAGDYEERLVVNTPNISLVGEDRESTLIHYYPGVLGSAYEAGGDMDKRCAVYIQSGAESFSAENISFANDYVYSTPDSKSNKSADALRCDAEGVVFVNVKLSGVQDTLYMHQGHQYYYKCRIEGLIDFIYSGDNARAFFNDCEIVFVYESTKTSGYVCAPKTAEDADYGLTFYDCVVIGEEGCSGTGYLLARPWGASAYITWISCYMGRSVYKIMPYGAMSGNQPENARFFEFGTYGPGYAINADRRQISPNKAEEMISDSYLGWSPASEADTVASHYIGSIVTDRGPMYVETEASSDTYLWTDGDDTGLKAYDLEGYAEGYGVSGGGLLKENNDNYYQVGTAEEFLNALIAIKSSGKKSVIELTADINLGCNEIADFDSYSSIIKPYSAQALTHPTLIASGVSVLNFTNIYNLTIFSLNGSSIKHANITMKNSENIIIRNIKFDELWEWDEATSGDYDRNDWDYMTIDQGCNGIWIDHCTFYKAYDGVIDVKNPAPEENVTISWCEFLPGSEDNIFFDVMMNELAADPAAYPAYQHMLDEGMTAGQIYMYAYGQKKTHLFGQSDEATNAAGIQVTLANNYYKNSMDRMPRLRYGYSHVYNCIMDAQDLLDAKMTITDPDIAKKIVSNGASSTCGAQVLLENCYINGILNALNSGNGSSPSGYINAINSVYYMDGELTELEPKCNSTGDTRVLVTDADAFISALPYSDYVLYDAEQLSAVVMPYAGAGKLDLTVLQWEKASYNAVLEIPDVPEEPEEPDEPDTPDESDDDDYDSDDSYTSSSSSSASASNNANIVQKPDAEDESGSGTWKKNDKGWWFEYSADGSYAVNSWHKIGGEWYSFDEEGYMETGWKYDKSYESWFYLEDSGAMATSWVYDESYGSWFYMEDNGAMATDWIYDESYGSWFYLDGSGAMKTGWLFDARYDGWFYLEDSGAMKVGWLYDAARNVWYYLKSNGIMAVNEMTPDGYRVNADGIWTE